MAECRSAAREAVLRKRAASPLACDVLRSAHRSQPFRAFVRVGVAKQMSPRSCTDAHVCKCSVGRERCQHTLSRPERSNPEVGVQTPDTQILKWVSRTWVEVGIQNTMKE